MTMTWGMWFSTASIITSCCSDGVRTCIRRALPIAGCGMSPSPAISFDVSTTTTRLPRSSASTRAASRSIVVLPMPGPAHDQDRLPGLDEVVDDLDRAVDGAPDPARQPDDLAAPVADRADPVERPLDAGPVVVAERADVVDDVGDVGLGDLAIEERRPRESGKRASGRRPRSRTTSISASRLGQRVDGVDDLGRQGREQGVEVVDRFAAAGQRIPRDDLLERSADAGRHEGRLGDPDERFLHQQRDGGDRTRSPPPRAADRSATRRSARAR